MNIPLTLLYAFLAVLQICIYFSVGIIAMTKKLMTPKSIKTVSELVYTVFLPLYAIIELSEMATWNNVEVMWILIIATLISILLGYFIAWSLHWLFKLDVRIVNSFSYLTAFPSLGTCPLVLGKAFCYPGGMLEGDPLCANILGFMVTNYLIFQILLFLMGFILVPKDANFNNLLMDKMSYLWHILIPKVNHKNYTVNYIFKKFMKDKKKAEELFHLFEKKYHLAMIDEEHLRYKFKEDPHVALGFELPEINKQLTMKLKSLNKLEENGQPHHNIHSNSYFESKSDRSIHEEEVNLEVKENEEKNEKGSNNEKNGTMGNTATINTQTDLISDRDIVLRSRVFRNDFGKISVIKEKVDDDDDYERQIEKIEQEYVAPEGDHDQPEEFHFSKDFNYVIEIEEKTPKKMSFKEEIKLINTIIVRKKSSIQMFEHDIELYYNKLFAFVDVHLDEKKEDEYEEFKLTTMKEIYNIPPKFPTVRYVPITRDEVPLIEEEWENFLKNAKNVKPDFELAKHHVPVTLKLILNKIYSPPIVSCFLGLIIGMSGMRNVLFSDNHYITNLVEGINLTFKTTIPLVYMALGISMISIKNMNFMNTPLTKTYIILTFLVRFVIVPCLGYLYVYLWAEYYGGIIATSKVFRISLFFPFCLPATATAAIIINMIKYFGEETGLILFTHNVSTVVSLTILYMLYYVILG